MKTTLFVIATPFAWYLVGFLSACIASIFDKPAKDYQKWLEERRFAYYFALLGPIATIIIVIIYTIMALLKLIKFCHRIITSNLPGLVRISDYMIAGFRNPPVKPEETDITDYPTASP